MLEPLGVVAGRIVGAEMRTAAFPPRQGPLGDDLRDVEQPLQLQRLEDLEIERSRRRAAADRGILLAQAANLPGRLGDGAFVAKNADFLRQHGSQRFPQVVVRHGIAAAEHAFELRRLQREMPAQHGLLGLEREVAAAGVDVFGHQAAEDQRVEQGISAQPVGAMHAHAGTLAGGVEIVDRRAAADVRVDAAHGIVLAGLDRYRFLDRIEPGEVDADLANAGQPLEDPRLAQVTEIQMQVAPFVSPAFVDLGLDRAGDNVARGEFHHLRGIAGHEPLAVAVDQVAALAPGPFGNEDIGSAEGRGMELHELQVLDGNARRQRHADAAAGVDQGVGRIAIGPAVSARGEDAEPGGETLESPLLEVVGDQSVAAAVGHGDPRDGPLVVDLDPAPHELLVEGVQEDVPGPVGGVAGPREAGAAEGALGDRAVVEAAERRAPAFELVDHLRRQPAHFVHGRLVGQVIAPLDGVEGVSFRGVVVGFRGVSHRGVDAALSGAGMGTHGMDFGEHGHVAVPGQSHGRPQPRQAPAHYQDIVLDHRAICLK